MNVESTRRSPCAGHITIGAEGTGLSVARKLVYSLAGDVGMCDSERVELLVAVGEALSNAYVHGAADAVSHLITLDWYIRGGELTVIVKDEGSFRSREESQRDPRFRGWGIVLMDACVDELILRRNGGTEVTLRKKVGGLSVTNTVSYRGSVPR